MCMSRISDKEDEINLVIDNMIAYNVSYIVMSYTYTCPKDDTDVAVCTNTTVQCNYLDISRAVKCHIKGLSHRICRGRSRLRERIDSLFQINSPVVTMRYL